MADETTAALRFTVDSVDPEYGDETDGTQTYVLVTYESSDVLWGTAPYDTIESGTRYLSFVVPGGTLTWETSEPLFEIGTAQYYPGKTYLGFLFHGDWDIEPTAYVYRLFEGSGKDVWVNDEGQCVTEFDVDDGPSVGGFVTEPLPIYGPLWNSERLEIEVGVGPSIGPPNDVGQGSYPDDEEDPDVWEDNFDNCPSAATIESEVVAALTSHTPVSTTWVSVTTFDEDDEVMMDNDPVATDVCWVDYDIPYSCEDTPTYPEYDAVLETFDEASIVAYFTFDDLEGDELFDWTAYGNGALVNEGSLSFGEDELVANQGTAIGFGATGYANLEDTRWNYIHQTGEFTVSFWLQPDSLPGYYGPLLGSSNGGFGYGFLVDLHTSGAIRALFSCQCMGYNQIVSSSTISTGSPAHVAITGDGSTLKLYVNGEYEGSTSTSVWGTLPNSYDADFDLVVGKYVGSSTYFDGTLDDLVFLDYGASATEISAYYAGAAQTDPFDHEDVSDLTLWLDTSDSSSMWTTTAKTTNVSTDNDQIQAIDDLSGNGNDLVYQTSAPTYQTEGFNLQPTARFGGGTEEWRRTSFTNSTPQTVVFVGRNDDATYGFVVTSGSGTSSRIPLMMDTSPVTGTGPGFDDSTYTPYYEIDVTLGAVYVAVFDDDDMATLYVDGIQVGSAGYSDWTNSSVLLRVGGVSSTPDFDLSELRVYNRALTNREVMSLSYQLRAKWEIE